MIKGFTIGGKRYTVKVLDNIEDNCCLGIVHAPVARIELARLYDGEEIAEDIMEQTLYHEVVHAILDELGYDKLSSDEKFVQSFSLLLHQFETTKKK